MRFLSIAAGISILLTLPAAALAQDNTTSDSVAETAEDTRTRAYAEEGTTAGDALARSRNYLRQAQQMANEDITADFAAPEDAPAHAPLNVDDEIVLPAGTDPD